jgi:hypothetical protein
MIYNTDVDIDLGDRDQLLKLIEHVPAAMRHVNPQRKHGTGVYVQPIPYDPFLDAATIDYREAEDRGYFKLDLLNVYVYQYVRDETHLNSLMREPDWNMLSDRTQVEKLIHLNNHYNSLVHCPEPVNSIPRLAMFLAIIRPAKRHLLGLSWDEVAKTVWDRDVDGYTFRKSHAVAYAQLVVIHMNMLSEGIDTAVWAEPPVSNTASFLPE